MEPDRIEPFTIEIPDSDLVDLGDRLARTRFPAPLPGDSWDTGVPVAYLRALVEYWQHGYDWRLAERAINAWPQYLTNIDGTRIHFLHVPSPNASALPLVITHGWPGSVAEFLDIIGPLADPASHGGDPADAFHVVIPSLPGFGFSGPVPDSGWNAERIARTWAELMRRLGYDHYGAQGGDIGAGVSVALGGAAPGHVVGIHVNGSIGMPDPDASEAEQATMTDLERRRVASVQEFMREQFGYIAIQSTRPQTLAAALVDSPVGQLAWIVDKFREWTYPREALPDAVIDRDRLLTNVMIYWLTGTGGSSAYVGYAQPPPETHHESSTVPTGVIMFDHDVGIRRYAGAANITTWTDIDRGGHFAALEEPNLLVEHVRGFFRDLRSR